MKKPVTQAYSYIRFSSPEQAKGDSLRRQTKLAQEWAERNGVELVNRTYRDLGVSAFKGKNSKQGALAAFLAAVEAGQIAKGSILIIESLDRLARMEIDDAFELWRRVLKTGIEIVTTNPERHYTPASLNKNMDRIEVQFIADRAHEESRIKSDRVAESWQGRREAGAKGATKKLTSVCPKWLSPVRDDKGDVVGFEVDADKAEVIAKIFQWCIDGMGLVAIARRLNESGVKPFAQAAWNCSALRQCIVCNRAVIGEYQPQCRAEIEATDDDGQPTKKIVKQDVGKPIADYYPAVIDEATYDAAQRAIAHRNIRGRGRIGKNVANLFTGLFVDVRDGQRMHLEKATRRATPALVSYGAKIGAKGSVHISLPYPQVEEALLMMACGLTAADILPTGTKTNALQQQFADAQAELDSIEGKIAKIKNRLRAEPDIDTLIEQLASLDKDRKLAVAELDRLRGEMADNASNPLDGTQQLIAMLAAAEGDELVALRTRLRARLGTLIKSIECLVVRRSLLHRSTLIQVTFRAGGSRLMLIATWRGGYVAYCSVEKIRPLDLSSKTLQRELEVALTAPRPSKRIRALPTIKDWRMGGTLSKSQWLEVKEWLAATAA